jgi:hypothetical protein
MKSNQYFTTQEEGYLNGETLIFSGITEEMAKRTLDGTILPTIRDSQATCYVGIQFPTGYVGVINEISFFLDVFDTENVYDHLFIEGSRDNFNNSVEQLVAVSKEAHEGWNYYDLSDLDSPARYQYYRLRSDADSKGCDDIGEIHYIGYEVINNDKLPI